MSRHIVTLQLHEVSTDRLLRERDECIEFAQKCNAQGSPWHDWDNRRRAIEHVLEARRRAGHVRTFDDVAPAFSTIDRPEGGEDA